MRGNLLEGVALKVKGLTEGGYARGYSKNGSLMPSAAHLLVAEILDALHVKYAVRQPVFRGSTLLADFVFGDTVVLIDRRPSDQVMRKLRAEGRRCIQIAASEVGGSLASGLKVVGPGKRNEGRLQTIFLDDPSFNFDYAHILPKTQKCSVMHGHTSSALVELVGAPIDGMVVDFNDAKPIIREAISQMDHKLFISERYVTRRDATHVRIAFKTVHGVFSLRVPKETTVLLGGEATVENLAQELLGRIAPKMPDNVTAVGVYVYEGLNKGTHLLAEIHRREAGKRRRKR